MGSPELNQPGLNGNDTGILNTAQMSCFGGFWTSLDFVFLGVHRDIPKSWVMLNWDIYQPLFEWSVKLNDPCWKNLKELTLTRIWLRTPSLKYVTEKNDGNNQHHVVVSTWFQGQNRLVSDVRTPAFRGCLGSWIWTELAGQTQCQRLSDFAVMFSMSLRNENHQPSKVHSQNSDDPHNLLKRRWCGPRSIFGI